MTILDVVQAQEDAQGKTHWHKVGIAFADQGKVRVKLNSLPIPQPQKSGLSEVWLNLFKQEDRSQGNTRQDAAQRPQGAQQPQTGYDTRQPANAPQQAAGLPQQQHPPHVEPEPGESGADDIPF